MRILTFSFFTLLTFNALAQDFRVIIEGEFEDWATIPLLHSDTNGDDSFSNIDFTNIKVSHDDNYIFFQFNTGTELNLQSNNDITLYLDTDNNASTGINFHGIGAELRFNFGERDGTLEYNGNSFTIEHDNIGLVTAPTVSGNNFEIAISRDISVFNENIFSANSIKIVLEDEVANGDLLPNNAGGVSYNFDNENNNSFPEFSFENNVPESFRVLSYNVLTDDLFENFNYDEYDRIFNALNPQIIGFQEIYNHTGLQTAQLIENFLPSTGGENWYSGKVSPDIVCVSRFPIKETHVIDGSNGNQNNGAFLLEMPEPFDKELLFIVAHTPCCENNTGRQEEVDAIMAFIRDSRLGETDLQLNMATPIVIVGDMNMVGDAQNLETLITGDIAFENEYGNDFNPDWDNTNMEDAIPITTNTPFTYTWNNENSGFFPGRLDFILYSGSVLEQQNAFSLNSETLTTNQLVANNLFFDDVPKASDHFPVIADFKLKELVSASEITQKNQLISIQNIHPNPVSDFFSINFSLKEKSNLTISIINELGQPTPYYYSIEKSAGDHRFDFKNLELPSGIYFLKMKINAKTVVSEKIVIQ